MVAGFQLSLYMTSLKSLKCCIQFGEPVTEINTGKWGPNQGFFFFNFLVYPILYFVKYASCNRYIKIKNLYNIKSKKENLSENLS